MSSAFLRLIYPSSHIVSQKTTCRCLSLFTVWPAVSSVLSCYRIYDVYELEEIDNLARRKRDSGNRSSAVRKILQRDMLILFLLFPYCFYDRKTMKMLERTTKCSFKDKSSMSGGTDGLKVDVIAMFMFWGSLTQRSSSLFARGKLAVSFEDKPHNVSDSCKHMLQMRFLQDHACRHVYIQRADFC